MTVTRWANIFALRTAPNHYLAQLHRDEAAARKNTKPVNADLRFIETRELTFDDPGEDPVLSEQILKGAFGKR